MEWMASRALVMHRQQHGQILPGLMLFVFALIGAGLLLFQFGTATALQADAQTAADAAALAGAREVRSQLYRMDRLDGYIDDASVRSAAADYAERNHATLVEFRREGLDVVVTVQTHDALGEDAAPVDAEGRRGQASARGRVAGGSPLTETGGGSRQLIPAAPSGDGGVVEAAWREADRIDALRLPYVFGGGHQSSPAPPNGPFDCSGSVSRVLQAAGVNIPTMVSGDFEKVFPPGPGRITIYAYDGHVFMVIDGRGFGTSPSNPGGGAGWLDYNTPYHSLFKQLHVPVKGESVPENLGMHRIPDTGGWTPYEVILAPLDG
jgi:cell wall-associated NlpC family hydrolase